MLIERQNKEDAVDYRQASEAVGEFFARNDYKAKRVLVIIPDNTRSGPIGEVFKLLFEKLKPQAKAIDCLVALGTHQPLTERQI